MKWLRAIKAWFGCIDSSAQGNGIAPFTADQLAALGIDEYHVKEISLGYSGELHAGSLEICFSYSVRDGVFVNIKTVSKWRILFEFCDGNSLINDDREKYTNLLAKLKRLREIQGELDYREAYEQLQQIVIEPFRESRNQ